MAAFSFTCSLLSCAFDGSSSADADGTVVGYQWDFGDAKIAAGATVSHTFLNPGTYVVTLTVTDDRGATDSTTGSITVSTEATANLQISTMKAPATAASGQAIKVTDVTVNAGSGPAGASATKVWLSNDKVLGGDLPLTAAARTVAALAPGGTSTGSVAATIPTIGPGIYYLIAQADRDGQVAESNEADNLRVKPIAIGPDVTVKAIGLKSSTTTAMAPTSISVTTRNVGGAAAGATHTRLYRSNDARLDAGDVLLADFDVPALAPSQERSHSVSASLPSGTVYVIAVSDATAAVVESREGNNKKAVKQTMP
jgi:PKD repeat protein